MSEYKAHYVNPRHAQPSRVRFYPKNSVFRKSDLIDKGCVVFLNDCPTFYKHKIVCARHYDGEYKSFSNYCQMEYENCNSWRKWSMVKQERC
ncbi:unnamed protein product [Parnassius mnemosyne]|uniref:Kazal-like domain-containing protein n=1 Tax=Parnassius mnemosyne TaxID=213953 RepID=A0AAV1LHB1_9NEOP